MINVARPFLLLFLQWLLVTQTQATCKVSLPQKTNEDCLEERKLELELIKDSLSLTQLSNEDPIPRINITKEGFINLMLNDPVNKVWIRIYQTMVTQGKHIGDVWLEKFRKNPYPITDFSQYKNIYHEFLGKFKKLSPLIKYPFEQERFRDITQIWNDDHFFAEQRLAGINPVSITRITGQELEVPEYESIGCFKDIPFKKRRSLRHLYLNLRDTINWDNFPNMTEVINNCAVAAEKHDYKIFAVQFWGECFGDKNAENRYAMYGKSKHCVHGVGKDKTNKVYRVKGRVGTSWNKLSSKLNPEFNWEKAVQNALGNEDSLEKVINNGLLFALHHPSRDGLPTSDKDLTEGHIPWKKMRQSVSPIGLFVSKVGATDTSTRFVPVAIQIDSKRDSAVYIPTDGDSWLEAKTELQLSDLAHVQLVEHLVKTHLTAEPLCITMHRTLYKKHPLFQILQWHCRGVVGTNFLGFHVLASQGGAMDNLFAMGHKGTLSMVGRGYHSATWDSMNFYQDIKNRGVDDVKVLPYYPYRDDGFIIMDTITEFVTDYVNIYYFTDTDVRKDYELQQFANEVSIDGEKPGAAKGGMKGFPPEITTKRRLIETIAQFIWLTSAAHSVVGYPVAVYGSYTPNMPTKLYNITKAPGTFSVSNFPGAVTSAIQVNLTMNLGSLHFDQLLGYYDDLDEMEPKLVTVGYYNKLNQEITKMIKKRNDQRYDEGHLTYPFLLPEWIPNSIHT